MNLPATTLSQTEEEQVRSWKKNNNGKIWKCIFDIISMRYANYQFLNGGMFISELPLCAYADMYFANSQCTCGCLLSAFTDECLKQNTYAMVSLNG